MPHLRDLQICEIVRKHRNGASIAQIARDLHIKKKTVRRWVRRCGSGQNISRKKSTGRKPALDDKLCKLAEALLLDQRFGHLEAVATELFFREGVKVSLKTLSKRVKAYCTRKGRPLKVVYKNPSKQLTYSTMAKRLAFCKANLSRNWSQVMFTDRCKFHHHYPGMNRHTSRAPMLRSPNPPKSIFRVALSL
jgi:transposase